MGDEERVAELEEENRKLRETLERLRDAASSTYSELAGTMMHRRGHVCINGLKEPVREAYCLLKGLPYTRPVEVEADE